MMITVISSVITFVVGAVVGFAVAWVIKVAWEIEVYERRRRNMERRYLRSIKITKEK